MRQRHKRRCFLFWAATSGLFWELCWKLAGTKWLASSPAYPPWTPEDIYPIEGHECTFAEWEQPGSRREGGEADGT